MTGSNPILESVKRDLGWFEDHLPHHHAAPQTPAPVPATMAADAATAQEEPMPLSTLEDDVKNDLTQGVDWLDGFVTRLRTAAPGIIATSEAVGSSTVAAVVEAVAGRVLPPELETGLAAMVRTFVDQFAPQAVTAQAPQPPATAQ